MGDTRDPAFRRAPAEPGASCPADADLIERFKAGDIGALEGLVARHTGSVVRHAARILGDEHEAYDVAQEVFLAATGPLREWRHEAAFSTWLHRTTVNLSLSHLRRMRRAPRLSLQTAGQEVSETKPARTEDDRPSGLADAVRAAVRDLPGRQREVVALRLFDEMSTSEIASHLRTSPNNVRVSFHKGITRIREKLRAGGLFFRTGR